MDKKKLGILPVFVVIALVFVLITSDNAIDDTNTIIPQVSTQTNNESIGMVINSPSSSVTLKQLDDIFTDVSSSGIGRSNVYLYWNVIEPVEGKFDWLQSDILMGLNEKNNHKVTLYFSIINGETLGPFPKWIGKPTLNGINQDELVTVLDAVLSRYHIIDSVIIAGDTESQFRYNERFIPVYQELFSNVYDEIKQKHPDVKFGNSFALHNVLNKNLENVVQELSLGDFVAFSYTPTDSLNEISKNPDEAIEDLNKIFEILPNKKIGFFELSWSTSNFVEGNNDSQKIFVEKLFDFYAQNELNIEFMTWFRYIDQQSSSCVTEEQKIGDQTITLGGGSSMGTSEHVIERLNQYNCNTGLVDVNQNGKIGWNEFKTQIQMLN
ncbi:hypothetical protein OAH75_01705 [Nitrosopumilus sp.]|nr:hypothetical protein [Nitrosopumilus sp.]MDB4840015.1 hypothetical protein [Nitrosopumilus sp.]